MLNRKCRNYIVNSSASEHLTTMNIMDMDETAWWHFLMSCENCPLPQYLRKKTIVLTPWIYIYREEFQSWTIKLSRITGIHISTVVHWFYSLNHIFDTFIHFIQMWLTNDHPNVNKWMPLHRSTKINRFTIQHYKDYKRIFSQNNGTKKELSRFSVMTSFVWHLLAEYGSHYWFLN